MDHGTDQRYRMMQVVSEMASMARSILHKKRRQIRAPATRPSKPTVSNNSQEKPKISSRAVIESSGIPVPTKASNSSENARKLSQPTVANNSQDKPKINSQDAEIESSGILVPTKASDSSENARKLPLGITLEVFHMISHNSQRCSHLIICLDTIYKTQ